MKTLEQATSNLLQAKSRWENSRRRQNAARLEMTAAAEENVAAWANFIKARDTATALTAYQTCKTHN